MATQQPKAKPQDDERTKIGGSQDMEDPLAPSQEMSQSGLQSDADFERFLEDEFTQTALPNAPMIPGHHVCWLTTASQYDSVFKRQRLGYELVRRSELAGFDASNGQSLGGYEGFVTCNEMVLAKIPEARYQSIMKFFHHTKPLQEEEGAVDKMNKVGGERISEDEDGILEAQREMARKRVAPHFD